MIAYPIETAHFSYCRNCHIQNRFSSSLAMNSVNDFHTMAWKVTKKSCPFFLFHACQFFFQPYFQSIWSQNYTLMKIPPLWFITHFRDYATPHLYLGPCWPINFSANTSMCLLLKDSMYLRPTCIFSWSSKNQQKKQRLISEQFFGFLSFMFWVTY